MHKRICLKVCLVFCLFHTPALIRFHGWQRQEICSLKPVRGEMRALVTTTVSSCPVVRAPVPPSSPENRKECLAPTFLKVTRAADTGNLTGVVIGGVAESHLQAALQRAEEPESVLP